MADSQLLDAVYDRVKSFLPQFIGEPGNVVAGLNARWRIYRYTPGSIYRPHIDGAWPGSKMTSDGKYLYDGFGDRWSKLTFLIRLNDNFEGGETTYFTPARDLGFLDATPVCPRLGDCLVFPHGACEGSILHEGSPVLEGSKYVIRTEVLYLLPRHAQNSAAEGK